MSRILIAGATGLVGRHVLSQAIADRRVDSIVAPTRRPLPPHPKILNPVSDMTVLPADADWWKVDGVVCSLGTTRANAGSADAFRAIELDLQLAVARHARTHGAERFALTSSTGADPRSRFLYMRTKGEVEQAIAHLGWPSLTIVRPGAILGHRDEVRKGERFGIALLRVLGPIVPRSYRGNQARDIAAALLEGALTGPPGTHVVRARDIG